MITLKRFQRIERALRDAGYEEDIAWSEGLQLPKTADQFARAAVYVIVNSGMSYMVARGIFARCIDGLNERGSARKAFRHKAKAKAIDRIWTDRAHLFAQFIAAEDKLEFCETLPWIGPVTKYHLAKELGVDAAKPDVHLARLAARERRTVRGMCARLARVTGYRLATVDTILWRACATGILDSKRYQADGWRSAYRGTPTIDH